MELYYYEVQHPIMVPYGPLAFFPGYLEHTGEAPTNNIEAQTMTLENKQVSNK